MADEMTPEEEAAAREGFLGNPIAVAYAKAHAEGAVILHPGEEIEVGGVHVACRWADRPGVFRVRDAEGVWQPVDLGQGMGGIGSEWIAIPETGLEIREVSPAPHFRFHVRPIGVDST